MNPVGLRRATAPLPLLVTAVSLLLAAAPSQAHTLTKGDAALDARLEVSERADYQCNRDRDCSFAHYPKLTKYDCRRRSQHVVVCNGSVELELQAVTLAAGPSSATAYGYNTVPCRHWDGSASRAVLKHKPRKCTLGGRYGFQQVHLVKMRWRSWGGGSAYGRGVSLANMGARARVRVKLYRPVSWEGGTDRFTRARFSFNGQGWGRPLTLRLH